MSFDRTYEELKPSRPGGRAGRRRRFDRTYEELKPLKKVYREKWTKKRFDRTYEELKHAAPRLRSCRGQVLIVPMRN